VCTVQWSAVLTNPTLNFLVYYEYEVTKYNGVVVSDSESLARGNKLIL